MDSKTIATAGHVVYDGVNGRGIAIEAHIGYRGAAFDEVLPLRFKDSPEKEERIKLCMAGYPEDIPISSRGQFIRESKREIDFHLQSNNGMLHHQLDNFKGKLAPSVTSCLLTYLRQFWFSSFPDQGRSRARSHCNPYSVLQNPSTDSDHKNSHMTGRFYRVNQAVPLGHQGNILATIEQATTILITRGDHESINIRTDYICYRCVYCVTTKVQLR